MVAAVLSFSFIYSLAANFFLLSASASGGTTYYTAQPGDYLYKIGQRFGVPWQSIAQANNIAPPYIIYVGEELLIPSGSPQPHITTNSCTPPSSIQSGPRNVAPELNSLDPSGKYVMLRFDDGYQSQWVNALPVLQRYGFKAVFLIITGALTRGGMNYSVGDGWTYMSWQEVWWLYSNGYEISDHTTTHPHSLGALNCAGLQYEVYDSRQTLAQNGITYVPSLALPDGEGYGNATVLDYAYASGFSHVYPDGQDHSTAITNYGGPRTYWYELDAANSESFSYFKSVVSLASGSSFVVGLYIHQVNDHVAGTTYYMNTTNFDQDMAYLAANGYTVVLPSQLPGY
ncbi:MAG TPA: polysaccharide deacetylase family protein [Nitrososphaerales archaeon]|nr:polysaccharide deacetylase family protein [Nitrososphaerales archaeon]